MPERGVPFANVFNFRDLGGYRAAGGATVRWRRLFRADDLSRLTVDELDRFAELGIRTVIDLRRPSEIEEDGRIPAIDGVEYRHIHLTHPKWQPRHFTTTDERTTYVLERYREMAVASATGFGEALRVIAAADAAPLVFHCIAGKDRTGILAALTLSLLGVADEDVIEDYHLSEQAEAASWDLYTRRRRPDLVGHVRTYQISPKAAMAGFLAELREVHGSVEEYAASVGVGPEHIEALRTHLLEPADQATVATQP